MKFLLERIFGKHSVLGYIGMILITILATIGVSIVGVHLICWFCEISIEEFFSSFLPAFMTLFTPMLLIFAGIFAVYVVIPCICGRLFVKRK